MVSAGWLPDGPAADGTEAEAAPLSSQARLRQIGWQAAVMSLGGLIRLLALMAKNPTTMAAGTVVVTTGRSGTWC